RQAEAGPGRVRQMRRRRLRPPLANLDTGVADQQARVDDARKKAEAFATEHDIPYPDLGSAEKAFKASGKLAGTEAATKEASARYRNLDTYVKMLRSLEDQEGSRRLQEAAGCPAEAAGLQVRRHGAQRLPYGRRIAGRRIEPAPGHRPAVR